MFTVKVDLKDNVYYIIIGQNILDDIGLSLKRLAIGTDAVVVTNPKIKKLHGRRLAAALKGANFSVKFFEVPDSEESKSAKVAFDLIERIVNYDVKKKIFIIAFGGGVIGDLAGFIAATYKRGIPYIQVPTTFLAQIDSAIGGKVAIDLAVGKNLIGAFYQPKLVYSDVCVLSTLNDRQIKNGLSEAIKYGIISDKILFDLIEKEVHKLFTADGKVLKEVVMCCSRIKAKVVMSDEKETKGIRTILNFGHTVGHAIESANQYKDYHHGEAVALGMRVAVDISRRLGLLSVKGSARINKTLTLLQLPEKIQNVTMSKILKSMEHDKKFKGKTNRFVLTRGIGAVKVVENIDHTIIKKAISKYM